MCLEESTAFEIIIFVLVYLSRERAHERREIAGLEPEFYLPFSLVFRSRSVDEVIHSFADITPCTVLKRDNCAQRADASRPFLACHVRICRPADIPYLFHRVRTLVHKCDYS